ncbi:unnamed protein product [Malus baccata var. baccata]
MRNLEFHRVEREVQQLCELSALLESSLSIKQVVLRRNRFGKQCLAKLCEIVKRNRVIKEIMFSESGMGSAGAAFLASALKVNESLEELQIWEDSIGSKGAEELSKMIEVSSTLKVLTIFYSNSITATPLVSAVLARNRTVQVHVWSGENGERSSKVVEFLPENSTLRIYRLDLLGACRVACALGWNSTVKSLYLTGVGLKSRWAKCCDWLIFRWVLEQNQSLKEVILSKTWLVSMNSICVILVIVSSLFRKTNNREPKNSMEIEEDLQYWLRFIVSNCRRAVQQCMLPNVTVAAVNLIQKLRDKFQGFVDFYPTVFTVDARSLASVSKLTHHLLKTSKTVLQRVPRIYQLCNDLTQILSDWGSENYNKPAMQWKEFNELCQVKVPSPRIRSRHDNKEEVEMRRWVVATCLHHIGEVLGQLIRLDVRNQNSNENNGFISKKDLEKILRGSLQSPIPGMDSKVFENLDASDLVRMMLKLELCYKQNPSCRNSLLLIPSILEEGREKPQRWQLSRLEGLYAGRHLECDDSSHMFLTPGFFPRLQARISLILPFNLLFNFRILVSSNIWPECVQNLTPPRYRKMQFVSLQQLNQALLSVPADSMYDYQHTWDPISDSGRKILRPGFDLAWDLLSDDDFREVLRRRYHDLYNLAQELQIPPESNPENTISTSDEPDKVDPTFGGITKGVEAVLQRLKIIEQEIRDLKQAIQGLRYYEHRLLAELHRKEVPNMFYFVRTENYSRRLITNMVPGMNAIRLHTLCECQREMHVVEDQMGCELMQVDNRTVKSLAPYTTKFMKLLTFNLKTGANLAAGMGEMIPDLSRELAHLADSSLLYGAAGAGAVAAGAVGAAAIGQARSRSKAAESSRDIQQDQRTAQQWVLGFLRERRCSTRKDIAEKFRLWRVRYRDDRQIAWICRRHINLRAHEIIEVPL